APVVLAVAVYLVLRTRAIGAFPGTQLPLASDNPLVEQTGAGRWATPLAMVWRYLALFAVPLHLSGDYSGSAIPMESTFCAFRPVAGAMILCALSGAVLYGLLRRERPRARIVAMASSVFLAPYLIVGNLLVLNGAGFAERLFYFPSAGLCILAGVLLE